MNNQKTCPRCKKVFKRKDETYDFHWKSQKWCSANCRSNGLHKGRRFGERNHKWKGGRFVAINGYVRVRITSGVYALEHRFVMEKHLGRKLSPTEIVHHKNHNRQDNRIENLLLLTSQSKHRQEHKPNKETKQKISQSLKGRIFSVKHKKNLSLSMIGNKNGKK